MQACLLVFFVAGELVRCLVALAKVEQSLTVWHIAEYVYRLAPAVRYCRARAEMVGVVVELIVSLKHNK
ncbi:MAG: hypothetical protein ACFN20_05345 [Bacteroidota bacterium]